jgi:hypothetical protein
MMPMNDNYYNGGDDDNNDGDDGEVMLIMMIMMIMMIISTISDTLKREPSLTQGGPQSKERG